MKNYLLILLSTTFLNSCLPFDFLKPEPNIDFEDIYLVLSYATPELQCTSNDSTQITVVLKNINNDTLPELSIDLPYQKSKYLNMKAKYFETLSVKIIDKNLGRVIENKEVKITEVKISGGDPASREVNYCKDKGLIFKYF